MSIQSQPRVGQKIADVSSEESGLVAKMSLWLQQCLKLLGRNPESTVTAQVVGVSPYTYTNTGDFDVTVVISGGTVSNVSFVRSGISTTVASATNVSFTLNPGDAVVVTYSVLPTMTIIPR